MRRSAFNWVFGVWGSAFNFGVLFPTKWPEYVHCSTPPDNGEAPTNTENCDLLLTDREMKCGRIIKLSKIHFNFCKQANYMNF